MPASRRGFRALWLVAAFTCALTTSDVHGVAQRGRPGDIVAALEAYRQHRYADAISELEAIGPRVRAQWNADGQRWVEKGTSGNALERQQVAAVIALEASHLLFIRVGARSMTDVVSQGLDGMAVRLPPWEMLESGCRLVRTRPPSTFVRAWFFAANALFQGAQNGMFLASSRPRDTPGGRGGLLSVEEQEAILLTEHRQHALDRFPRESRLRFALLLGAPEVRRMPTMPNVPAVVMTEGYWLPEPPSFRPNELADRARDRRSRADNMVAGAIDALTAFASDPEVGLEARLRRGVLRFSTGQLAGSMADFDAAATAPDAVVAYLGHFYAGLSLDVREQRAAAADAYAAALRAVPYARSGVAALTSDLLLLGREAQASRLAEAALAAPAPDDPWRSFSAGDYRFWPMYLAQLRDAIGQ